MPTERLYWKDDHAVNATAIIIAVRDNAVALDRTCFYAGGGGQSPDTGWLHHHGNRIPVTSVEASADGHIWHLLDVPAGSPGDTVTVEIDADLRNALARYHSALHVVNTIALRDYNAWITGAQIGTDYSRIDFKWEGFAPAIAAEMVQKVNAVLATRATLRSFWLEEAIFAQRPHLLRTLDVCPSTRAMSAW